MKHKLKQILDRSAVNNAMMDMARQIYKHEIGFPLAIIAILKGGAYTAYELLKLLDIIHKTGNTPYGKLDVVIGHIGLESYGDAMKAQGEVKLMTPLDLSRECLRGRKVVIVDDCIETGNTLFEAEKIISSYNPASIHTAVLVDKVTLRMDAKSEEPDIVGWQYTGSGFLVGVGMGMGEKYRGLPEICEVVEDRQDE